MDEEKLLAKYRKLKFDEGQVYAIGRIPSGLLLAVETMESVNFFDLLVTAENKQHDPVPLGSYFKFMVPVELFEEPVRWIGKIEVEI